MGPQAAMLGRRLHLQHGPIDLIILAEGDSAEVRSAYRQAHTAFDGVLEGLVADLTMLKTDVRRLVDACETVSSPVSHRMIAAMHPHGGFVTSMAAVAGAVADTILSALRSGRTLRKAMVNNGGDIALWLTTGETATIGVGDIGQEGVSVRPVTLSAADGIGGIATSGWRGRSYSLGIADFATVFAADAAAADVAATLIANAVDLPESPKVSRKRADELSPDSDLGARAVTVDVGALLQDETLAALAAGETVARGMIERGLIDSAAIGLQGEVSCVGFSPDSAASYPVEPTRLQQSGASS